MSTQNISACLHYFEFSQCCTTPSKYLGIQKFHMLQTLSLCSWCWSIEIFESVGSGLDEWAMHFREDNAGLLEWIRSDKHRLVPMRLECNKKIQSLLPHVPRMPTGTSFTASLLSCEAAMPYGHSCHLNYKPQELLFLINSESRASCYSCKSRQVQ